MPETVADLNSYDYIMDIIRIQTDGRQVGSRVLRPAIRRNIMDKDFEKLTVELDGLKIKQEAISHNTAKTAEKLDAIEKTLQAIYDLLKNK